MTPSINTLGILDWGIGGIGLYQALLEKHPNLSVVYFSDAGFTPYGKVSPNDLQHRIAKVVSWFEAQGVDHLAIACNAASTCLPIPTALPYSDIIEQGANEIFDSYQQCIAILGGVRTIESRCYQNLLQGANIELTPVVAQPLSALIEAGASEEEIQVAIECIVEPIAHFPCMLLACTHYPAVKHLFENAMKSDCEILDPVDSFVNNLSPRILSNQADGIAKFYTTGDPLQSRKSALNAFGISTKPFIPLTIDTLSERN